MNCMQKEDALSTPSSLTASLGLRPRVLKVFLITALASVLNLGALVSTTTTTHTASPYFSIRSQGTDAAREMVGLQPYTNLCGHD